MALYRLLVYNTRRQRKPGEKPLSTIAYVDATSKSGAKERAHQVFGRRNVTVRVQSKVKEAS